MHDTSMIQDKQIIKTKETRPVDLHAHSCKSDGSLTPSELVELAASKHLAAVALTDHDTVAGIDEALAAADGKDIELVPGIEFSTEYEGRDIHIVGLYINHNDAQFQKYLQNFIESRDLRNQKMCQKLQEHGLDVRYEDMIKEFAGSVMTRAHYAAYLFQKGYVKSIPEAFKRYVGDDAPCFVPREKVTPGQAAALIVRNGGVPVLAHPILYHMPDEELDRLTRSLTDAGLAAIEAVYCSYSTEEELQIRRLAAKYELLLSGGSDFHGKAKPGLELGTGYGGLYVPYEFLSKIKERLINNS